MTSKDETKVEARLIFTFDDGYTAIIKVWEYFRWGRRFEFQTIHPRK